MPQVIMENFDLRLSLLNAIENLSGLPNLYRISLIIVLFIFVVLALSPTIELLQINYML